jgi:hypothetical protein
MWQAMAVGIMPRPDLHPSSTQHKFFKTIVITVFFVEKQLSDCEHSLKATCSRRACSAQKCQCGRGGCHH